ncbi:MAG TPA: phosphatidylserine/phosphatidylglycerophosphate/cardiolipin synthase family protein, partial [Candidatus Kapabacteria bacterium]|nr:phosphatidylserine/phosphatidylglycerophosphate/cardiolipin synthase family protein [Candidatus Kapabacteria bacterium]
LRAAGAEVLFFNHQRRRGLWRRLWSRTHRKILIVDEEVAFIGGVNISKHMKEWNDIQVRLEGEILYALLRSFRRAYLRSGGKRQNVRHLQKYRRLAHEVRDARVEFIWDDCNPKESRIRKRYAEALKTAKERVILFSPYYFPDRQFIRALWHARRRGVRVDLLLPLRTDVRLATHAAYAYFSLMKKFGVNVFLTDKMMHGKGVIVDDEWAMVGSCNIDQTSFYDNYEASVRIRDKQFVRSLRETMKRWFLHARTLDELKWERRGIWQRCKERVAHKLFEWWHVRRSSR